MVLVGFAITAVLGTAAVAIDMGFNYSESRRLQTATDAAALAAAQAFAAGDSGCDIAAPDFLQRNADEATLVSCVLNDVDGFGWVSVEASLDVDQFFAAAIGKPTVTTTASSAAALTGGPGRGSGLRPMGLCWAALNQHQAFIDWVDAGMEASSDPVTLPYDKGHPDDCGGAGGNWGILDLDGDSNSNSDTVEWIRHGYPGQVSVGYFEGDPGAISGSHQPPLQYLVDSGEVFRLAIFTTVENNGGAAQMYLADFAAVQLVDFRVAGRQSRRYLEITFHPEGFDPECCSASGNGVQLIAIDTNGNPIGTSS